MGGTFLERVIAALWGQNKYLAVLALSGWAWLSIVLFRKVAVRLKVVAWFMVRWSFAFFVVTTAANVLEQSDGFTLIRRAVLDAGERLLQDVLSPPPGESAREL